MKYFFTLLLLIIFSSLSHANDYYRYTDQNGNQVYSDKKPNNNNFSKNTAKPIQTTEWQTSPPLQSTQKPPKKKILAKTQPNKSSKCISLKQTIIKLENKLRSKLKATDFDKAKQQLSDLRWQRQKTC